MYAFPRDPQNACGHIRIDALRPPILTLLDEVDEFAQRAEAGMDRDLAAFLAADGGWNIVHFLTVAAACALLRGLDDTNYAAAMVEQALVDHGFHPISASRSV